MAAPPIRRIGRHENRLRVGNLGIDAVVEMINNHQEEHVRTGSAAAFVVLLFVLGACAAGADLGTTTIVTPSTASVQPTTTPLPPTLPSTTTTAEGIGCAAAGLPAYPGDQDLPLEVAQVRNAIVGAAVGCDADGLARLAGESFTYSFGGDDDPAAFWAGLEERSASEGDPSPLTMLVRLLELPFATIDSGDATYYVWPSAHAYGSWDEVPGADRDALLGVYGAQDLADFEAFGGYVGYRVGITADGDWAYFVAGD